MEGPGNGKLSPGNQHKFPLENATQGKENIQYKIYENKKIGKSGDYRDKR